MLNEENALAMSENVQLENWDINETFSCEFVWNQMTMSFLEKCFFDINEV